MPTRPFLCPSIAFLLVCAATNASAQSLVFRPVVFEGDPAPGMPGLVFAEIGTLPTLGELLAPPAIDKRGDIAFHAFAGPGPLSFNSPRGMWREIQGQLTLVVQGGDPAPGTATVFGGFPAPDDSLTLYAVEQLAALRRASGATAEAESLEARLAAARAKR